MVCGYTGSVGSLPDGWVVCDGTKGTLDMSDSQVRCTKTAGSIAAATGSNTHTHTSPSHTHAAVNHNHTLTTAAKNKILYQSGLTTAATATHTHGNWSVGNSSFGLDSATATFDSSDVRHAWRSVMWIMLVASPAAVFSSPVVAGDVAQNQIIEVAA